MKIILTQILLILVIIGSTSVGIIMISQLDISCVIVGIIFIMASMSTAKQLKKIKKGQKYKESVNEY